MSKRLRIGVAILGVFAIIMAVQAIFDGDGADSARTNVESSATETRSDDVHPAQQTVASHLGVEAEQMGFSADYLQTMTNPTGEGIFVYSTQTRFSGVLRTPVWFQYQGTVYALNGPAHTLTEGQLPWPYPRTGEQSEWEASGLLPSPTSSAVGIVYGPNPN